MPSDRKIRKFTRQWRKRYPYPLPWVDDRANKQCRRSEDQWLARFDGSTTLKRKDVLSLALWKFGGQAEQMEQAVQGIASPADWGRARRTIKRALVTSNPTEALVRLLGDEGGIAGWGPTMASVVLGVCQPNVYAVADQRVLRTLKALQLYEPAAEDEFLRADWWPYLRISRRLSDLSGMSLRDVSRALWAAADDAPSLPQAPKPPMP